MAPQSGWVGLAYSDQLPSAPAIVFKESLASIGLEVELRSRSDRGPVALVEWLVPTVAAVVLTQLAGGFFQEAGADVYRQFKKTVGELGEQTLGQVQMVTARGPKPGEYSPAFSIVILLDEGWQLKVLLRDDYSESHLERIVDLLLEDLRLMESGGQAQMLDGLADATCFGRTILVEYDESLDSLLLVDPGKRLPRG